MYLLCDLLLIYGVATVCIIVISIFFVTDFVNNKQIQL